MEGKDIPLPTPSLFPCPPLHRIPNTPSRVPPLQGNKLLLRKSIQENYVCESCERVCCVHLCMRARAKVRMRACCPSDVTVTRHLGGSALRHARNPGTAIFCVKNSLPTGEAVSWPPTEVPTAHHFPLLASHRSTRPF